MKLNLPCFLPLLASIAASFSIGSPSAQASFTETEPLPLNRTILSLAGAGDTLVASGVDGGAVTRLSGDTWVENVGLVRVFDYEDGKFHGWRVTASFKYVLQTSTDGLNWTDVGSGQEFDGISAAAYDDGKYLVAFIRHNQDQIFVSNDNGSTWTETNDIMKPAGFMTGGFYKADFGFGRWFLRGPSNTNAGFLTSTDGISWGPVTVPVGTPTQHFREIGMSFPGAVGLVTISNALLRTTDGLAWTEVKRFSNGLYVNAIAHNDGDFLLGRTDYSGRFILEASTDAGLNFSIIPNVHANRLEFIENLTRVKAIAPWKTGFAVAGENGFVLGTEDLSLGEPGFQRLTDPRLYHYNRYPYQLAVNGNTLARIFNPNDFSTIPQTVQTSTDGGFTWSTGVSDFVGLGPSPKLLALGGKYFLMTNYGVNVSDDAINWIEAQSPAQFNSVMEAYSMTYDGTRWLAVINAYDGTSHSIEITASNDGITWTIAGAPPVSDGGRLLYVGGEYFYITGSSVGASLYRSSDLTNWSLMFTPVANSNLSEIGIYNNGNRWLIRGFGPNRVSDDGVTFYDVPNLSLMPTGAVVEYNGQFYATSNFTIIVSSDLHFWKATDTLTLSLQDLLTANANGLLLAGRAPQYVSTLPVAIPDPVVPSPPATPLNQTTGGTMKLSIPTELYKYYYIQTNPKLNLPLWNYDYANFPSITGDGTVKEVEFTPSGSSGYFRVVIF